MKLLSIGNSFSQDAHRWLHKLAAAQGTLLETTNLYIGGCSLQTHWENFAADAALYDLEPNGGAALRKISIKEALLMDSWDVITLQQASHYSGIAETYYPYLTELAENIRELCPSSKLYFHQTWAYETDSRHDMFYLYDNDQQQMYDRLTAVINEAAACINAPLIPVGRIVQHLRSTSEAFDYNSGGLSLCRDGFHLSLDYGRYAAAAVWYKTLTGKNVSITRFEDFDPALLAEINAAVNSEA